MNIMPPKARVNGLAASEDCIILRSFVLIQYLRVTDGRTDGRTDRSAVAKTSLSTAARCKID